MNIVLWGIGERTKYYTDLNYFDKCSIVGYVCTEKETEKYNDKPVFSIDELVKKQDSIDYIVISNEFFEEIIRLCKVNEIDDTKLVMTDNIPLDPYRTYYNRLQQISPDLFELLEKTPYILTKRNESDIVDAALKIGTGKYSRSIYMQDYYRYRTFELVARELSKIDTDAAVAELGVFRGHFSSLINEMFGNREIYLFDTFEGFDEEEAKKELDKGQCEERFILEHKDTSLERMLANLPYPQKAKICKGFFPQSLTEEAKKQKFLFVSIDVDFEESMLQGLRFFYPRMIDGGVIFVHDYNTFFLDGIKEAVARYEGELGKKLYKIPIADRAGTLVIMK